MGLGGAVLVGRVADDGADGTALYAGRMRPRPLTAGALACLALVAMSAACSGSGTGGDASTTAATKAAKADTRELNGPGCRYIVAGTESRSTPAGDTLQYLTSAVTEPTECYDKITFEFDPGDGPDLPPGYTVEYRKPPFIEGIKSSTEGFDEAKYVLYVELRPVSTKDTRASARGVSTYKGNLRLAFVPDKPGEPGMVHTTIVEWLDKAPPSVPGASTATTSTSTTTSTTTATEPGTKKAGTKSGSTTSSTAAPTTTSTTVAPVGPTTTTTLAPNDPATSRVVWLIGLDSKRPFTVDASNQPPKVSILIMH